MYREKLYSDFFLCTPEETALLKVRHLSLKKARMNSNSI